MADVTEVSGSRIQQALPGFTVEFAQIETGAAGEDGVTFTPRIKNIVAAYATSNELAKGGDYALAWSGSTVTLTSIAGATGDDASVSIMVVGW
jgi:hypothetical protein